MIYFDKFIESKEDITMPHKIKDIIKSTGFGEYLKPYSSKRQDCVELSYNQILGKNIDGVVQKILHSKDNPNLITEASMISKNEQEINETIKIIYETLYGKLPSNSKLERKLILNSATFPIKINLIEDDLITNSFYIKKPDTNRLIGSFLYGFLRDDERTTFAYNEKLFIEQEIKGNTLLEEYDELLMIMPEYKRGIGKAAARAEFLGVHDDVLAERNRIIDDKYNTILFDFDNIFEPLNKGERGNHLMMHYAKKNQVDINMVQAYREEKRNIAKAMQKYKDIILPFAEQANKLKDVEYGTIKQKIKNFSGHSCLKEYIVNQTRKFSQS